VTDRELLQQALDALETHAKQYPHMVKGYTVDAVQTIRTRLAQSEKEWVGLTHEEKMDILTRSINAPSRIEVAEALLKEKNNG